MKRMLGMMLVMVMVFAFAAVAGENTVDVKVKGMTCGACVEKVKTSLEKVDGVTNAKVDLEKAVATVTYDDSKSGEKDLEKAVKDAGFKVEKAKEVKKADCASKAGCCGSAK